MPLTVSQLRILEKQVLNGEISYSRMVELINERVNMKHPKDKAKELVENLNYLTFYKCYCHRCYPYQNKQCLKRYLKKIKLTTYEKNRNNHNI